MKKTMHIKGTAKVDKHTKILVKRLTPEDIAIINHRNLDNVAAQSLLATRPKAIINAACSITGDYPNSGPLILVRSKVVLLDNAGEEIMKLIKEGQTVEIINEKVVYGGKTIGYGQILDEQTVKEKMAQARHNMNKVLVNFIQNTIEHAQNEIGMITGEYKIPQIKTKIDGRHILIVIRGENYKEDLKAIRFYLREEKPVLIGVDGGADALIESGYQPDIIIGDMDSVSTKAILSGAELIVHAYPNGFAPGMERITRLGKKAVTFATPGTSEDIAILLAYEKGAELIVVVGAHFCVEDFLEKGRRGMGSTFLVRLKTGSILVDAKGVSRLYRNRGQTRAVAHIFLAALLPIGIVIFISPATKELLRLIFLQLKLIFGI